MFPLSIKWRKSWKNKLLWRVESFLTQSSSCCIKNHYLYLHILSTAMHSCLIFFYQATSINLMIGDLLITCFQGVQKEASGMKWVNEEHNLFITSTSSSFITIADMAYFRVITSITSKKKKKINMTQWSKPTNLGETYTAERQAFLENIQAQLTLFQ